MREKSISFENYLCNEPSVKVFNHGLKKPNLTEEYSSDLFDSHNRKILKGSFQKPEPEKIALAHHDLVVPAYLFKVEEKTNVDDIINGLLYSLLKFLLKTCHLYLLPFQKKIIIS